MTLRAVRMREWDWPKVLPLVVSSMALAVALGSAWLNVFRPARIIGDLSYVTVWRFSSSNDGRVTDMALTPAFWLRNIGARPAVVRDMRLVFEPAGTAPIVAYAATVVPPEATGGAGEFNEYGRISSGPPFRSFSLVAAEERVGAYRFGLERDHFGALRGEVKVSLQVNLDADETWSVVFDERLDFGSSPHHLQPMLGGVQSIPVYTQQWARRRGL